MKNTITYKDIIIEKVKKWTRKKRREQENERNFKNL